MSFFLALNVQTSLMHTWNWFEIHSAAFLRLHGRRSHKKEREACNKICTKITHSINKEMWYMMILICLIVISDSWEGFWKISVMWQVQSCFVLWLHLAMGELCKEPKDHKEKRLAGLPAYHPTFWSTELARTWKEANDRWNLECNSYVFESCPHQYQKLSYSFQVSDTYGTWTFYTVTHLRLSHQICWFNAIWTILWYVSCLANFRGFTIQFMSRQTSHSPTSSSLPVSPLLLSTSFQVRSMCSDSTRPSFGRETKTNRPQSARTFTRNPVKPLVHRQATFSDRFFGGMAGIASPESLPRLGRGPWSQRRHAFLLGEMIDGDHGEDHPKM